MYIRPELKDLIIFGISADELFALIRPLYGRCDSGDYWGQTIDEHLINALGMKSLTGDAAMFVRKQDGVLEGVTGSYVEYCLNAGPTEFDKHTKITLKRFKFKPRIHQNFDFFGTQVRTVKPGTFSLSQKHYTNNICFVPRE